MIPRFCHQFRLLIASGLGLLLAGPAAAFDEVIDSPMYRLPDLPRPAVTTTFPKGLRELWLHALTRPEVEMRVKAADAIALAHTRGVPGMDGTVDALIATLEQQAQHPAVRLAVTRAVIALDARRSAPVLFAQVASADVELRNLIEPALALGSPTNARGLARASAPLPRRPAVSRWRCRG